MPRLQLVIVGVRWPPATFVLRKAQSLAGLGFAVTLAGTFKRSALKEPIEGVKIHSLPHSDDPLLARLIRLVVDSLLLLGADPANIRTLRRIWDISADPDIRVRFNLLSQGISLSRIKADIIHFEWITAAMDYEKWLPILHCPYVVSCRGSQVKVRPHVPGNEALTQGMAQVFHRARAVHCVSKAMEREAQRYGLEKTKSYVIYPAVDFEFFAPPKQAVARDGAYQVVSCGNLLWVKGYEYALLAIHRLKTWGVPVHYTIIGNGPEYNRILYTVDDLGLSEQVTLLGQLAPEAVRRQLHSAHVFLLSSLSEGVSNSVLEAMACGLPIVTSDCGGLHEVIEDGREGFVVPVRNHRLMAEKMLVLWNTPHLCHQMGRLGRERIVQQLGLKQQAAEFAGIYRQIADPTNTTI